jgi:hypothetical protein
MRCPLCSFDLPGDANFCPACGGPLDAASVGPTQRLIPPAAPTFQRTLPEGVCPKCGSTEIYVDDRGLVDASGGITVINLHDIWHGSKASINTYICVACGYLELFLGEMDRIPDIVQSWRRVR